MVKLTLFGTFDRIFYLQIYWVLILLWVLIVHMIMDFQSIKLPLSICMHWHLIESFCRRWSNAVNFLICCYIYTYYRTCYTVVNFDFQLVITIEEGPRLSNGLKSSSRNGKGCFVIVQHRVWLTMNKISVSS